MNTIGSFQCVCVPGYELLDGTCQRKFEYISEQFIIKCVIVHISDHHPGIAESVTSAPVVQQVVPNIGENNRVNFTVTTFSVVEVGTLSFSPFLYLVYLWFTCSCLNQLTAEVIQRFRRATAQAVTRYCSETPCITINSTNHMQRYCDINLCFNAYGLIVLFLQLPCNDSLFCQ